MHRRRGAYEQARGAYEEAVRISRDGADRQILVLSLVGLALLLVCGDIVEASALATEAMATARGCSVIPALLAVGHVRGWPMRSSYGPTRRVTWRSDVQRSPRRAASDATAARRMTLIGSWWPWVG